MAQRGSIAMMVRKWTRLVIERRSRCNQLAPNHKPQSQPGLNRPFKFNSWETLIDGGWHSSFFDFFSIDARLSSSRVV
jgi:hypothetical protein